MVAVDIEIEVLIRLHCVVAQTGGGGPRSFLFTAASDVTAPASGNLGNRINDQTPSSKLSNFIHHQVIERRGQ